MDKLARAGEFCPHEDCQDYGKLHAGNLQKFGKTLGGVQRLRCTTCGRTFTETTGTIFFRKRTPDDEIMETLALLAEGSRISSLSRAKGQQRRYHSCLVARSCQARRASRRCFDGRLQSQACPVGCLVVLCRQQRRKKVTRRLLKVGSSGVLLC